MPTLQEYIKTLPRDTEKYWETLKPRVSITSEDLIIDVEIRELMQLGILLTHAILALNDEEHVDEIRRVISKIRESRKEKN